MGCSFLSPHLSHLHTRYGLLVCSVPHTEIHCKRGVCVCAQTAESPGHCPRSSWSTALRLWASNEELPSGEGQVGIKAGRRAQRACSGLLSSTAVPSAGPHGAYTGLCSFHTKQGRETEPAGSLPALQPLLSLQTFEAMGSKKKGGLSTRSSLTARPGPGGGGGRAPAGNWTRLGPSPAKPASSALSACYVPWREGLVHPQCALNPQP